MQRRSPRTTPGTCPATLVKPLIAVTAALLLAGCVSSGPVAPLVTLPDHQMPGKADLAFRPWRVVVADVWGRHRSLEESFAAELKNQLTRHSIQNVSSDAKVNAVMRDILQTQLRGGGDVTARDIQYEVSNADGIISVQVTTVTVKKNNEKQSWKDKKEKIQHKYTSEVYVAGHVTLTATRSGSTRTIQFAKSATHVTYDNPHQFSVEALALSAVRSASRSNSVIAPIYTEFPLAGYVIGTGQSARMIMLNRGAEHGVKAGRKWDFMIEQKQSNALVGEVVTRQVIGGGKTMEVHQQTCIVKCDSSKTRQRVKLGMKAFARGFGFMWPW